MFLAAFKLLYNVNIKAVCAVYLDDNSNFLSSRLCVCTQRLLSFTTAWLKHWAGLLCTYYDSKTTVRLRRKGNAFRLAFRYGRFLWCSTNCTGLALKYYVLMAWLSVCGCVWGVCWSFGSSTSSSYLLEVEETSDTMGQRGPRSNNKNNNCNAFKLKTLHSFFLAINRPYSMNICNLIIS